MSYITKIKNMEKRTSGYWAGRIFAQLKYAIKVSKVNKNIFNDLIENAVNTLDKSLGETGLVSRIITETMENELADIIPYAKKYTLLNVAHAHIDMNWMWDFSETVAITLGTFRTMLELMKEYPDYTFSQSQASVYKIVEDYDPDMLEEIKTRVKEGRWEVTASTWVEADKNMPNGESHARHILYTKRYLSELLDLPSDTLLLDFEPDTFGHNHNVPEILSKGGVKYYYHCRGFEDKSIYRWKSPSGKSILVFKDPMWYNLKINNDAALYVPEFCEEHGIDSVMKVYGVGDHGGGPTRKDIECLIDMSSWPIYPNVKFSTYSEFFKKIEAIEDSLEVVEGELNFVFSGCYTTQARIKTANRIGEARLDEAETISSISNIFADSIYPSKKFNSAWEKILFNQFHDIIPGSGTIDTREYAMGEFQKVLAAANTEMTRAMGIISSRIDTASLELASENLKTSRSEGAGVGFEMGSFNIPHPERGAGLNRIMTVFNPTQFKREEVTEILVWDWEGDRDRLSVKDSKGKPVKCQIVEFNDTNYWDHTFVRLLIYANVTQYGYSTYVIYEEDLDDFEVTWSTWPRLEKPDSFILENHNVKVEFDDITMRLKSFVHKETGSEIINVGGTAGFRYVEEDPGKGMTAWIIGRYMKEHDLGENVRILEVSAGKDALRQWISYEQDFLSSKIKVKISLDKGADDIRYEVECDWLEKAEEGKSMPQLNFHVPLSYKADKYKYDIPFGTIDRDSFNQDVPANSWMAAENNDGASAMMITNNKYGFRGYDSSLAVTLLRSSYDPDPYPDNGIQKFGFVISPVNMKNKKQLIEKSYIYNHPLSFISNKTHAGDLPLESGFMEFNADNAVVSAVKVAEDSENGLIIRLYETEGVTSTVSMRFDKAPISAHFVDLNETPTGDTIKINGNSIDFNINPFNVESIRIEF